MTNLVPDIKIHYKRVRYQVSVCWLFIIEVLAPHIKETKIQVGINQHPSYMKN